MLLIKYIFSLLLVIPFMLLAIWLFEQYMDSFGKNKKRAGNSGSVKEDIEGFTVKMPGDPENQNKGDRRR